MAILEIVTTFSSLDFDTRFNFPVSTCLSSLSHIIYIIGESVYFYDSEDKTLLIDQL